MRKVLAGLLVAVAAILAPVAVTAVWLDQTVTEPDRYLEVVSTVSALPEVREQVRDAVVDAVVDHVNPGGGPGANLVRRAVGVAVDRVLGGERFAAFWLEANRAVHAQVTGTLAGSNPLVELTPDGTLTMNLRTVADAMADQLASLGIEIDDILGDDDTVVLLQNNTELVMVQTGYDLLRLAARWLPWICGVALVLGLLLARRRFEALTVGALVTTAATLALIVALTLVTGGLEAVIAMRLATTLWATLEPWLWTLVAVAAAVALVAWLLDRLTRRRQRRS